MNAPFQLKQSSTSHFPLLTQSLAIAFQTTIYGLNLHQSRPYHLILAAWLVIHQHLALTLEYVLWVGAVIEKGAVSNP